ncbi:kinase-like domain-containing protein [Gigaspora rosea]|uniref:Kinase-like domain-containing protein n=1 Tax=Gigaspora rosea TaxID=44941 RepID=A0A397UVD5_9GLOM|nr:kinase-like domain-containing protein [Gigaspora rosea]
MAPDRCSICRRPFSHQWCQKCEIEAFKRKFRTWTSGNTMIDGMIQDTQLRAINNLSYLEWIPFENIVQIEYRARGVFSVLYSGIWFEGPRQKWDDIDGYWLRKGPTECALKKVENFDQTTSQEYLNNIMRYSQCFQGNYVVDCLGITRDPNDPPGCYMFVMKLCEENLYKYIDKVRGYIRWSDIVIILRKIIDGLKRIHDNGLYHGNLHGGNLLIENIPNIPGGVDIRISDIGLYGPVNKLASDIYGVLPYVAPEILNGNEYTQASDIYSFGIIMWTLSTCMLPFEQDSHDSGLATRIRSGLRPTITNNTPRAYSTLMKRCWHQDLNQRPDVTELRDIFNNNPILNLNNDRVISERSTVDNRSYIHAFYNGNLINF